MPVVLSPSATEDLQDALCLTDRQYLHYAVYSIHMGASMNIWASLAWKGTALHPSFNVQLCHCICIILHYVWLSVQKPSCKQWSSGKGIADTMQGCTARKVFCKKSNELETRFHGSTNCVKVAQAHSGHCCMPLISASGKSNHR